MNSVQALDYALVRLARVRDVAPQDLEAHAKAIQTLQLLRDLLVDEPPYATTRPAKPTAGVVSDGEAAPSPSAPRGWESVVT